MGIKCLKWIKRTPINKTKTNEVEVSRGEVDRPKLTYRDENGKVKEVEWTSENFDKVMSNKNNCLVFK